MPFFATTVTGCFIRAVFDDSISDPPHCVAEIVSVMKTKNESQFGSKRTNLVLNLRHAGEDQIVNLRSVSNQEFTKHALALTPLQRANKQMALKWFDRGLMERRLRAWSAQ
ncbi:unnamed protein product [Pleuronectes platessa]|uniref:Plus3 domain-containing protein n=1 Tax=Pleuronectes platessa TaxID=8262 RepID=A0A9N7VSQ0_PLEPL|nr:unnamed protein product [Pleuronectes platessa]